MLAKSKITNILLISILLSTMGAYLIFPKKTQAAWPVVEVGTNLTYNFIQQIKETLIAGFTQISSLKDVWEQAYILATDAMRVSAQNLLEQILQRQTNDILSYINDNDLIIKDFYEYYGEQAGEKTAEGIQKTKQDTSLFAKAPIHLQPIYKAILDEGKKDNLDEQIECNLSANAQNLENDFTWEGWMEYWENPACNPYGATLIASNEKARIQDKAKTSAMLEIISPGTKPNKEIEAGGKEIINASAGLTNEMVKKATFKDYDVNIAKVANLASSLGPVMPYITNLVNSFLNNLINQGLAAFNNLTGPTSSSPTASMPSSATSTFPYLLSASQDLEAAEDLLSEQTLLAGNFPSYSTGQISTLDVLNQKKNLQIEILNQLKNLYINISSSTSTPPASCSMPNWTEVTLIDSNTVKITSTILGAVTFKKDTGVITMPNYQADIGINSMGQEIQTTNQNITALNLAITATENFIPIVQTFIASPNNINQATTLTARSVMFDRIKEAVQSQATNLFRLYVDTQNFNFRLVQDTLTLQTERGAPGVSQPGTLYNDIIDLNNNLTDLNQIYQGCPF